MPSHSTRFLLLAITITGAWGCNSARQKIVPQTRPATLETTAPVVPSSRQFSIDPAASSVRVLVYRGGALARLGHNHVISSTAVEGTVTLAHPLAASTFALRIPLASFVVDDPALRTLEGDEFSTGVPDADRAATRGNMLGTQLLDAQRYPMLRIDAVTIDDATQPWQIVARVDLAGQVNDIVFDTRVAIADGELRGQGVTTVSHTQLGLSPFSALLGALRVQENITLKFDIVANTQ